MNTNISYITAFLFGLMSSTHCISMCGGIISFLSLNLLKKNNNFFLNQLIYNLGRVTSYGIIGFLIGFLGSSLFDFSNIFFIKIFYIFSSILIIMMGLYLFNFFNFFIYVDKLIYNKFSWFNFFIKKIFFLKSPFKELFLGLIWGNVPCGLVYSALWMALTSGSLYKSFFLMFFFGLGTVPAIMMVGTFYNKIKNIYKIKKIAGSIMLIYGSYMFFLAIFSKSCHSIINHSLFLVIFF